MSEGDQNKVRYYISPMGTVEQVSEESLEGDRDYVKDFQPSGPTQGHITLDDIGRFDE